MAKTVLFIGNRGNVAKLPDPHFGPNDVGLIKFQELTDLSAAIVVTDLKDHFQPRYQIVQTLGNRTLLNTFGRSMNMRTISGICYESFCTKTEREQTDRESGYVDLSDFFNENNATIRETPITITVGKNFATQCYLLEMTVSLADVVARVWQFSAMMIVDPAVTDDILDRNNQVAQVLAPPQSERISDSPFFTASSQRRQLSSSPSPLTLSGDRVTPTVSSSTSTRMIRAGINPFIPQ
jgi:hypothetical protein